MTDLTPLPGAAEDSPVLRTQKAKFDARDIYIDTSGGGIIKWHPGLSATTTGSYEGVPAFVVSTKQDDVIKLKGGDTGASFSGFLFFSNSKLITLTDFVDNKKLSKEEATAFAEQQSATAENYQARQDALDAIRKLQREGKISVIREIDSISLNPGETFTITNNEDAIAEEYFTEMKGRIQWGIGFEVVETQYNAALDANAEFGKEIEDQVTFKWLATSLFKFFRPAIIGGEGGPEDVVIAPEEEGGFQIETETLRDDVFDAFGDFGALFKGMGDTVKNAAGMAVIILSSILAIFLMITLRKPLQGAAGGLTEFVKESISR